MYSSNMMALKGPAQKMSHLKILFGKPGSALAITKTQK
jgi:hypothetical protein